jgi:hypothetical protein
MVPHCVLAALVDLRDVVCALAAPRYWLAQVSRVSSVVKVVVRQRGRRRPRFLACYQQTMEDGRVRERDQLPSAKMHAGEGVVKGAVRCLLEELGEVVSRKGIHVQEETVLFWDETGESPSYPGLTTAYRLHQVVATIHGLPTNNFASAKARTRYHWEWRQDAPGSLVRKAKGEKEEKRADAADGKESGADGASSAGRDEGPAAPPMYAMGVASGKKVWFKVRVLGERTTKPTIKVRFLARVDAGGPLPKPVIDYVSHVTATIPKPT